MKTNENQWFFLSFYIFWSYILIYVVDFHLFSFVLIRFKSSKKSLCWAFKWAGLFNFFREWFPIQIPIKLSLTKHKMSLISKIIVEYLDKPLLLTINSQAKAKGAFLNPSNSKYGKSYLKALLWQQSLSLKHSKLFELLKKFSATVALALIKISQFAPDRSVASTVFFAPHASESFYLNRRIWEILSKLKMEREKNLRFFCCLCTLLKNNRDCLKNGSMSIRWL